jgi:hypothetical protein
LVGSPIGFDQSIWQMAVPLASELRCAARARRARSVDDVIEAVQPSQHPSDRADDGRGVARHSRLAQCATLRLVFQRDVLEPRIGADFAARSDVALVADLPRTTFVSTWWACRAWLKSVAFDRRADRQREIYIVDGIASRY